MVRESSGEQEDGVIELGSDGSFDISISEQKALSKAKQLQEAAEPAAADNAPASEVAPTAGAAKADQGPMAPAPGLREKFDALVAEILKEIPGQDEETQTAIEASLTKGFNEPKVEHLEFALQKRCTPDEIRHLMFFPTVEQFQFYPRLLADAPSGAPEDHPQRRIQARFLAVFYLHHARDWRLIAEFIEFDGLATLASLFTSTNLYVRSQAMDSFMQITGNPDFDWFAPADNAGARKLHHAMLSLSNHSFIKALVSNRTDTYPGGSFYALQIMAFWFSWMRILYCKNNELRLSRQLLDILKEWSERTNEVVEEKQLATKVYEDFSRFPAAGEEGLEVNSAKNNLSANPAPPQEESDAEKHRQLGNGAFKRGDFSEAISQYEYALKALSDQDRASKAAMPVLTNLAFALLKRNSDEQDLLSCVQHCDQAIEIEVKNVKAHFRRSQALAGLSKSSEAIASAKTACECSPGDKAVEDWLHGLLPNSDSAADGTANSDQTNSVKDNQVDGNQQGEQRREQVAGQTSVNEPMLESGPFIPSSTFQGAKEGYVFKLGKKGVGYYSDTGSLAEHAKQQKDPNCKDASASAYYHFKSDGSKFQNKWESYDTEGEVERIEKEAEREEQQAKDKKQQQKAKQKQAVDEVHKTWSNAKTSKSKEDAVLEKLLRRSAPEKAEEPNPADSAVPVEEDSDDDSPDCIAQATASKVAAKMNSLQAASSKSKSTKSTKASSASKKASTTKSKSKKDQLAMIKKMAKTTLVLD
jgi:tetratricopeptide (TPR) repeat protein